MNAMFCWMARALLAGEEVESFQIARFVFQPPPQRLHRVFCGACPR